MIRFVDSSAAVGRYLDQGVGVPGWLSAPSPGAGDVALVSALARVEIPSACWRLVRAGELTPAAATAITRRFLAESSSEPEAGFFVTLVIDDQVLTSAVELLPWTALRAADAIQLATALAARTLFGSLDEFVSLDRRLRDAAAAEGFTVRPD